MRLFFLLLIMVLPACTTSLTKTQIESADYGVLISESDARVLVLKFLDTYLKYPESAVIDWDEYEKAWFKESYIYGGETKFGYKLNARIKSKGISASLAVTKRYVFMLRDASIISAYVQETQHGVFESNTSYIKIY